MSRVDDCPECVKFAVAERDACDAHADGLPPGAAATCKALGHQLDYESPGEGLRTPCVHIGHARCRRCRRLVRYWFRISVGAMPLGEVLAPPAAEEVVDALLADLNDRGGLGLDGVDEATRAEIRAAWVKIVRGDGT